jgi:hypothetical protein
MHGLSVTRVVNDNTWDPISVAAVSGRPEVALTGTLVAENRGGCPGTVPYWSTV